jgi:hypothetical protein
VLFVLVLKDLPGHWRWRCQQLSQLLRLPLRWWLRRLHLRPLLEPMW